MSESSEAIEVTAPSVDEAIRQALDQLGAAEDDVVIQVLSTPRAGVLGLGARQARVRVERRPAEGARSGVMSPPPAPPPRQPESTRPPERRPQPPPPRNRQPAEQPQPPRPPRERSERRVESSARHEENAAGDDESAAGRKAAGLDDQVREATNILSQILELMGERGEITTVEEDSEGIELAIKGDGSGLLIGRHGQTLDSLEYLVNRIQARRVKDAVPITIDTESYRERRRRQLHRMALSMAEQTKREHASVTLDPMPPRDRRIVHLALKDDPLITTRSTGDGFLRVVEIIPVGERREGAGARGGRPRGGGSGGGGGGGRGRERERETEPARERDQPIGQQGGFKHGQKRMF
jgi:spoIIIJ-associated protein